MYCPGLLLAEKKLDTFTDLAGAPVEGCTLKGCHDGTSIREVSPSATGRAHKIRAAYHAQQGFAANQPATGVGDIHYVVASESRPMASVGKYSDGRPMAGCLPYVGH